MQVEVGCCKATDHFTLEIIMDDNLTCAYVRIFAAHARLGFVKTAVAE